MARLWGDASVAAGILLAVFALLLAADDPGNPIVLDRAGHQGAVSFDHATHVKAPQDPASPYPAGASASCGGCHHTRDGRGVIQLVKCEGCHGPEGDPRNPKGRNYDEENRETAFHRMCIGCHADLAKIPSPANTAVHTGPADCVDCHKPNAGGSG